MSIVKKTKLEFHNVSKDVVTEHVVNAFEVDERRRDILIPDHKVTPFTFVAERASDKQLLGICIGFTVWNEAHITFMVQSPELMYAGGSVTSDRSPEEHKEGRLSTGRALLRAVEHHARSPKFDCTVMDLDVYSWQNVEFLTALGFKACATQHRCPKAPYRKYYMELAWGDAGTAPMAIPPASVSLLGHFTVRAVPQGPEVEALRAIAGQWTTLHMRRHAPELPPWKEDIYAVEARLPAAQGGTPAGWTLARFAWGEMHVSLFAVNPDGRGSGAGTQIVREWERVARERGCTRISLVTMAWQAKPFYEKNGFKHYGTQKNIVVGGDRYFMEKILAAEPKL